MKIAEWIGIIATSITIATGAGAAGLWVADKRYVTHDKMLLKEIRDLDRQITFIKIKIDQDEATTSEKIHVQALEQQLRDLQQQVE